jgi:hypothetical protein
MLFDDKPSRAGPATTHAVTSAAISVDPYKLIKRTEPKVGEGIKQLGSEDTEREMPPPAAAENASM